MWISFGYLWPFYLAIITISVLIISLSRYYKWKMGDLKFAALNFIVIYMLIVLSVFIYDAYLSYKLQSFDLDQDGIFSNDELTPEASEYLSIWVNDLGRNLAPYTGFIFTFIYTIICLVVIKLYRLFLRYSNS